MSRKKKLQPYGSIQREIARRLQAGLPLAGMIAATTLLTGCHEHSENFPAGSVPRDPALYEHTTEQPKPKTPPPPKKNGEREGRYTRTTGIAPSEGPNGRRETVDPAGTRGRFPATKRNK